MLLTRLPVIFCLWWISGIAVAQNLGLRPNAVVPAVPALQPQDARSEEYRLPALPEPQGTAGNLQTSDLLFVKEIRVDGVTAFEADAVTAVVRPYVDRIVSSGELQTLRLELSQLYVDGGYVSSGVLLPDQQVTDGVVVYKAIEGTLQRVELAGDSKLRSSYVAGRLQRHVRQPLNVKDLQYALRYLEQDSNILRLDAALRPGEQLGQSVLSVKIDDEPRFSLGVSTDNHRASSTGAERGSLTFTSRNLTGFGEEFVATFGLSAGTDEKSAALSVPFLARNATLQLFYSESDADIVERAFKSLDIESHSVGKGIKLRFPFIEELDTQFGATLGFEANRSQTRLLGMPFSFSPGAQDGLSRTAVGSLRTDAQWRSTASVTAVELAYRRGFDALDATIRDPNQHGVFPEDPPNPVIPQPDGIFANFQVQATHIHRANALPRLGRLGDRAQIVLRAAAQVSKDPLLSLEKFAIGGVNTIRGIPEGLLVRDNGVAATFEIQLPIIGYRPAAHPLNLVLVPFIDYGRSWDKIDTDPGSDERNTDEARYIITTGIGALWNPLRGLTAQLYMGTDIGNNFKGDDPRQFRGHDLQDEGVHFSLGYVARW